MSIWRSLCLCLATLTLGACVSSGKIDLKVHAINALSSTQDNDGSFQGLEYLADPIPGSVKNRVNIFYLHGIGWTENPEEEQLANDFLSGIAKAYGRDVEGQVIESACGIANKNRDRQQIYITTPEPHFYNTAISGAQLKLDNLVCMDKQTLDIDENLEFVVYRIFWDDIFWNSLQFQHVGQDDDQGSSKSLARLRRKYNRKFKDELVNYGISDAVMYLGPAGAEIRNATRGAMCSAALDSAGYSFSDQGRKVSYDSVCQLASNTSIQTNQFAFVSESLGSKITYDVLREAQRDNRDTIIDDMILGSELYMLANQIALLSLSDITLDPQNHPKTYSDAERPKIIAMSELNDFLTYEMVPFYEQLWKRSLHGGTDIGALKTQADRQKIIDAIGFDVVDMRLEFADKLVPVLNGLVDPLQAHSGHANEPELMLYMLCGAENAVLRKDLCLASVGEAREKAPLPIAEQPVAMSNPKATYAQK